MKTKNLKTAIEKAGYEVHIEDKYDLSTGRHVATGKKNLVHWYDQGGEATCVHSQNKKDETDIERDYFPGWFCRSIKEVIRVLKEE